MLYFNRLTHTPSVIDFVCIMDSEPWTSFSVTTCPFRGRFQSFSSFFPMKRSVLPTWKKLDGATASSVRIAMPQAIPSASPLVPVSCAVASAATIRA